MYVTYSSILGAETSNNASTSATGATGAAIGGSIAVTILLILLIITLCILLRCVINSRKKKNIILLNSANLHFTKASSNSGRYIPESLNMTITKVNSEVEERICK